MWQKGVMLKKKINKVPEQTRNWTKTSSTYFFRSSLDHKIFSNSLLERYRVLRGKIQDLIFQKKTLNIHLKSRFFLTNANPFSARNFDIYSSTSAFLILDKMKVSCWSLNKLFFFRWLKPLVQIIEFQILKGSVGTSVKWLTNIKKFAST